MSQLEKWQRLAEHWVDQGPPATPSDQDVRIIESMIRAHMSGDRPSICILGSTPQLRSALRAAYPSASITVVDFCSEMLAATSKVIDARTRRSETIVTAGWLELGSVRPNAFDICVGDKALDNIAVELWPEFFDSMSGSLRPRGLLLLHVAFPDPKLSGLTVMEIAVPWLVRLRTAEVSLSEATAGLWEDLLSGSAASENDYLSLEPYMDDLEACREMPDIGPLATAALNEFGAKVDAKWANFTHDDVVEVAARHSFELIAEENSTDYWAATSQPIMCLRRNNT